MIPVWDFEQVHFAIVDVSETVLDKWQIVQIQMWCRVLRRLTGSKVFSQAPLSQYLGLGLTHY